MPNHEFQPEQQTSGISEIPDVVVVPLDANVEKFSAGYFARLGEGGGGNPGGENPGNPGPSGMGESD